MKVDGQLGGLEKGSKSEEQQNEKKEEKEKSSGIVDDHTFA